MARNALSLSSFAVASVLAVGCGHLTAPHGSPDPSAARIVADDIPRFWTAFDAMHSATDTMPLRAEYLDRGTTGLTDFTNARWKNAKTLTAMVWPLRAYYSSIRQNTLTVSSMVPSIRRAFQALDTMYDGAIFPDVYFAIGGMSTGGTTSNHGLLIGVELFSRAPDSPVSVLSPWGQTVVRSIDVLPAIVAHELTHYQQRYSAPNLLAQSIREGSADFVGELLTGQMINDSIHVYGNRHEAEIWRDFKSQMNGSDLTKWLYNGGSVSATNGRPADLGYYVGYKITAAYYAKQADKRRALRDLLQIKDFPAFLAASGYGANF
jgi:hypothetical protein